jgi:conjugative relaxase-like TrwC/TraI family protein
LLRVAKVAPGGHAYYLGVAAGPTGPGLEPSGRWLGAGAASFGLHGTVDGDALGALLAGDDPRSFERLGRAHHRVTVAAFDLTFCAPKSVSLLHGLGVPALAASVRRAHEHAVDAALGYVERRALAVRRSAGGVVIPEPADAVASAGFVHRVSRALDPHLHSHVVLANLGRGPDGSFTALDGRGIYAHAAAAGSLYHAQLRHELTARLGVAFEPLRNGRADVAGIAPETRRAFSQRSAAIAEHLAARGLGGSRARVIAGHATRPNRDLSRTFEDLRASWQERAQATGLSAARLEAVVDRVPRRAEGGPDPARGGEVVDALRRRGETATRRDVVRAWCATLPAGAPVADIERAADGVLETMAPCSAHAGRIERRGVGERRHVTTGPELRRHETAREHDTLARLLAARGMELPITPPRDLARSAADVGLGWG